MVERHVHTGQSTTARGDQFELQVQQFLKRWVRSKDSYLNAGFCEFYRKKGYYSQQRDGEIELDVAIEVRRPGMDGCALLIAVECKNYSGRVPVDAIEEFSDKLWQLQGHTSIKGMMFSTNGFQEGAINRARNRNIALVRLLPPKQVQWVLQRAPSPFDPTKHREHAQAQVLRALIDEDYVGQSDFAFGLCGNVISASPCEILNAVVASATGKVRPTPRLRGHNESRAKPVGVPFLGLEELEQRSARMRNHIDRSNACAIDLDVTCKYFNDHHGVDFGFNENLGVDTSGRCVLGQVTLSPSRIRVDRSLARNSPRWRFTLAHEIAHLVLHRALELPRFFGIHNEMESHQALDVVHDGPGFIGRVEWQANAFASCLLMPRHLVIQSVISRLRSRELNNFGHGVIYLDNQRCNLKAFYSLLDDLCSSFGVSRQVATYRLAQLHLLNDQRANNSLCSLWSISPDFSSMFID